MSMHIDSTALALFLGFVAHAWIAKIADLPARPAPRATVITAWVIGGLLTIVAVLALFRVVVVR